MHAEQVAFITGPDSMEMCGLEFCGNASRSFGLMLAEENYKSSDASELELPTGGSILVPVKVSGADSLLEVAADPATGWAEVSMPLHRSLTQYELVLDEEDSLSESDASSISGTLVDLRGIMHLVLEDAEPDDEMFEVLRKDICDKYDPPAMGVMFMKEGRMYPVVYVRDVDTVYHEGSCASGTTAAAIAMTLGKPDGSFDGRHDYEVVQPAGKLNASVEVRDGKINDVRIGGPVELSDIIMVEINMQA